MFKAHEVLVPENYEHLQSIADALAERGITTAAIQAVEQYEELVIAQKFETQNINAIAWGRLFSNTPRGSADYMVTDGLPAIDWRPLPGLVGSYGHPSGSSSERYDISVWGGNYVATVHVDQRYFACKLRTNAEVRDLYVRPSADPQAVGDKLAAELARPTQPPLQRDF